jgi:DNA-binding CsgD family transcriptional regulator
MDIQDFIERSNEAVDADQLYRLLEEALSSLCGYDRIVFTLGTDHPNLGLKAGHGVMHNYPQDWVSCYNQNNWGKIDPVVSFGLRYLGPFTWDRMPMLMQLTQQQKLFMNEGRDAGLHNGAALSLRGPGGMVAGIGVATKSRGKPNSEKDARYKLSLVNMIAHQFYTQLFNLHEMHSHSSEPLLTEREVAVLHRLARGQKDETIASDLGVTKHAVNFHTRHIYKKLNASNRLSAVVNAIRERIIALEDATILTT